MSRTSFVSLALFLLACSDDGGDGGSGGASTTSSTTSASSTSASTTTSATTGGTTTTGTGGSGSTSTGMGGGTCSHDLCEMGEALVDGCLPCVTQVCAADAICCDAADGGWDQICVEEAVMLCGIACESVVLPGALVVTEIMNNPEEVADTLGEWFEVYNTTMFDIDLAGYLIHHDLGTIHVVSGSVVVPSGGYAVIGNNADTATNGGVNVDYVASDIVLGDTADFLQLESPGNGYIIDFVEWDEASGLDPSGASRTLDPTTIDATLNDDDTNFCEATSFISGGAGDRGTPGAANDACP